MAAILRYSPAYIPLVGQALGISSQQSSLRLQKSNTHPSLVFDAYPLKQQKQELVPSVSSMRVIGWTLVLLGHLALLYLVMHVQSKPEVIKPAKPMKVSIVAPTAPEIKPEPEIVPIVEPIKVEKNPIIKPKKVVENTVPVENPTQPLFEASYEPVDETIEPVEQVAAPVVVEKAAPKSAPIEEKLELPKFGVAYLNNPAPDYPGMAKRAGEEGRVLLQVLVSADGAAESVELEQSSGFERLDNAAIAAVSRWRFVPARKGGQTLSAYVIVPIKFSLSN